LAPKRTKEQTAAKYRPNAAETAEGEDPGDECFTWNIGSSRVRPLRPATERQLAVVPEMCAGVHQEPDPPRQPARDLGAVRDVDPAGRPQ